MSTRTCSEVTLVAIAGSLMKGTFADGASSRSTDGLIPRLAIKRGEMITKKRSPMFEEEFGQGIWPLYRSVSTIYVLVSIGTMLMADCIDVLGNMADKH